MHLVENIDAFCIYYRFRLILPFRPLITCQGEKDQKKTLAEVYDMFL